MLLEARNGHNSQPFVLQGFSILVEEGIVRRFKLVGGVERDRKNYYYKVDPFDLFMDTRRSRANAEMALLFLYFKVRDDDEDRLKLGTVDYL